MIWSSQEFGFCEPADEFSSGSSLMPQKKNPDAAELLRGKSPRVVASLTTLLGALHALPLAYSKDLQEDKEALFDAVDTIELCLAGGRADARGHRFDRERMDAAAADEMVAATDVADLLVRKGMPFREAHGVVGSWFVPRRVGRVASRELPREELAAQSELLDEEYYEVLREGSLAGFEGLRGAEPPLRVAEQLEKAAGPSPPCRISAPVTLGPHFLRAARSTRSRDD